jgi:hypothetical protein
MPPLPHLRVAPLLLFCTAAACFNPGGMDPLAEVRYPAEPAPTRVSLSGQVVSQRDGTPIDGARLSAGYAVTHSRLDGSYNFDQLAPGLVALTITHPVYDTLTSQLTVPLVAGLTTWTVRLRERAPASP